MEGLVISTRSFDPRKELFLKTKFKRIEEVNGKKIEQSEWRKISLPIYMLDLFSEVGIEIFEKLLLRTHRGCEIVESYNKFINTISSLIVEEDIDKLDFQDVYENAVKLREQLSLLINKMADKEPYRKYFVSFSGTKRYVMEDLISSEKSKFDCYEVNVDKKRYPFLPDYKCYVIRSFSRKTSRNLGKIYLQSITTLFNAESDFIIHDYDYGRKLLRNSHKIFSSENKNIILFKHNKGDIYQILQEGSFSLLYLYVKYGFELKTKTQVLASMIDTKVMSNKEVRKITFEEKYNKIKEDIKKVEEESSRLSYEDASKIIPSINKLKKCLDQGISDNYSLCVMMFNLLKLNDYVLWDNPDKK